MFNLKGHPGDHPEEDHPDQPAISNQEEGG
jgi:hypothetical protein